MPAKRVSRTEQARPRPATTPEGRENQLIAAAVDMAEEQIRNRTASSQVLVHYLKLATTRERLEQEQLRRKNILLEAQVDSIGSAQKIEDLYSNAINAMRSYAGQDVEMPDEDAY